MKVLSEERKYSAQDFERLPEGPPYYQLIVEGPPNVVVEVRSPSTAYYELILKKEVYERAGVKEYWLLDPNRKTFDIYKNTEEGFKLTSQAGEKGKVFSGLLKLEIDLKHAVYISKLERAINNREEFAHKTCHECGFGVKWDSMVVPVKSELPEEVKALVKEIEKIHCEFHEVSMQIDPKNHQSSDEEKLNRMKKLSSLLFQKLLALKRLVKEE
jgi:hypothetical protein